MSTTDSLPVTEAAQDNRPQSPLPTIDGNPLPVTVIAPLDDATAAAARAARNKRKLGRQTCEELRNMLV